MSTPFALLLGLTLAAPPALDTLASEVTRQIVSAGAVGPLAVLVDGPSLPLRDGFSTLLCAKLASARLGPVMLEGSPEASEMQARGLGMSSLVRLRLDIREGRAWARGDVLGTWVNFWSGRAPTRPPAPAAIVLSSVAVDATVSSLLFEEDARSRAGLFESPARAWAKLPVRTAALTAGDVTGDGKAELVALTDEELVVFSKDGSVLARWSLEELGPSPTPTREPVGVLTVEADHRIGLLSGTHARGAFLLYDAATRSLREVAQTQTLTPCGTAVRLKPGENIMVPLTPGAAPESVACSGTRDPLLLLPGGTARWQGKSLPNVGAGSTLAKWGGQKPTLVSSLGGYALVTDRIRVGNPESPAASAPVSGQVMQAVAAELDGNGREALFLGIWLPDGTSELRRFEWRAR